MPKKKIEKKFLQFTPEAKAEKAKKAKPLASPKNNPEHMLELNTGHTFTGAHSFRIYKHPEHAHLNEVHFTVGKEKHVAREVDIKSIAPPLVENEALTDTLRGVGRRTGLKKK